MNTAIIVAAGSGQRFGGDTPKQFVELLGKPILLHTIERFEACPQIDSITLVLSRDGMSVFERHGGKSSLSKVRQIVQGSDTRAGSVWNALLSTTAAAEDLIAVHDGVRPLVSTQEISQVIAKATETGAACLVAEVTDTMKAVEHGEIRGTVERTRLRRALTPQVFRYDILVRAFEKGPIDQLVTDECYLVERLGLPIATVEGSTRNIKITRPEDIILAEWCLSEELVPV